MDKHNENVGPCIAGFYGPKRI